MNRNIPSYTAYDRKDPHGMIRALMQKTTGEKTEEWPLDELKSRVRSTTLLQLEGYPECARALVLWLGEQE